MTIGKVFKLFSIATLAIMLLTSCGAPDPQEIADSLIVYYPGNSIFSEKTR